MNDGKQVPSGPLDTKRFRHKNLCVACVRDRLVAVHVMVSMRGFGTKCEWCGGEAEFVVDMRVDVTDA